MKKGRDLSFQHLQVRDVGYYPGTWYRERPTLFGRFGSSLIRGARENSHGDQDAGNGHRL